MDGERRDDAARWYQDGVIYELSVRSFADSNGDGIGDFDGLTSRLDHLVQLGVTALWLLPFSPSPLRDDGYDVSDHMGIHPDYGDLAAFRRFVREAGRRDLRIITELVVNHTSDQHAWFERARRAPAGSRHRNWYVWSDDPGRYADARVIFSDTETSNWAWDPVAKAYYWHRFFSHQPDLNFDSPDVRKAILRVVDFWFDLGVAGLRLDAVPYLFEREGTNCENLEETHAFLRDLRSHVDDKHPGRMLLAEANQWPEDAFAYFGNGDECHMNYHFPVMPRLFMGVEMEQRAPIVDIIEQTPDPPEGCQWATFLRNHDELTLEMVTDEERDYMYRSFAQDPRMRINVGIRRRLAPLLGGDRRKIELLNVLLFTLPGTPIVYYGDEIGMGDNIYLGDRDSLRTPMQWSPDRNAGFSQAPAQRLDLPVVVESRYNYESINVEVQRDDPASLLWWMSQLITLRRSLPTLGHGSMRFLEPANPHILAFVRELDGHEPILVVTNLSRFAQATELDLGEYAGALPMELFGHSPFAAVTPAPWPITLGPYGYFWFGLQTPVTDVGATVLAELPYRWQELTESRRTSLREPLMAFIERSRWYRGRGRAVMDVTIETCLIVSPTSLVCLVRVTHPDRTDRYVVPLHLAQDDDPPGTSAVARCLDGIIIDAMSSVAGVASLSNVITAPTDRLGGLHLHRASGLRSMLAESSEVRIPEVEQSNSGLVLGESAMIKLIRRPEAGVNPEVEIAELLSVVGAVGLTAPLVSWVTLGEGVDERVVMVCHELVPHDGDGWTMAVHDAQRVLEATLGTSRSADVLGSPLPGLTENEDARRLGERTAQLHLALTQATGELAPAPLAILGRRALVQAMRQRVQESLSTLRHSIGSLDAHSMALADHVLAQSPRLLAAVASIRDADVTLLRFRVHGDLHLGQILVRGSDSVFIDFEGEPARPLSERRIKRLGLVDVAGMARSYDYAAMTAARLISQRGASHGVDDLEIEAEGRRWAESMVAAYLEGYRTLAGDMVGLMPTDDTFDTVLRACSIEKAAYELTYELAHRPEWVSVPLRALIRLASDEAST